MTSVGDLILKVGCFFFPTWKAPATPVGEKSWEGGILGEEVWPIEEMILRGVKLGDWEGVKSLVPKAQLIILTDVVLLFLIFPCLCPFVASYLLLPFLSLDLDFYCVLRPALHMERI